MKLTSLSLFLASILFFAGCSSSSENDDPSLATNTMLGTDTHSVELDSGSFSLALQEAHPKGPHDSNLIRAIFLFDDLSESTISEIESSDFELTVEGAQGSEKAQSFGPDVLDYDSDSDSEKSYFYADFPLDEKDFEHATITFLEGQDQEINFLLTPDQISIQPININEEPI